MSFALATLMLGQRSLWGDEAFSVWASKQALLALWRGLDAQPPLYHTALAVARAMWGESEFAVRFLSALCTVLLVPIGFQLARAMGLRFGADWVALAVGTAPAFTYFAQEARMYALATLLAAVAMWMARRGALRTRRSAAVYAMATLAALLTHYYTVGVLLVNAGLTLWQAMRARALRQWMLWFIAHAGVAVVFLGWFLGFQSNYASRATAGRTQFFATWAEIAENIPNGVRGLLLGLHADGTLTPVALAMFVLALLGALGYWRARRGADAALLMAWVLLPLLLVSLTASRSAIVPDFHPRYYLFALLPLLLALGGWTMWRWRWVNFGLVVLVGAVGAYGNAALFDPTWAKSRYAALIAVLWREQREGDAVVMVNSDQFPLADYYRPPALPLWIVPNDWLLDEEKVRAELEVFMRGKARVWLVNYGWATQLQPPSPVERVLRARGVLVDQRGYQDAALLLFDLRVANEVDAAFVPQDVLFGDQIRLVGVRARKTTHRAGESVVLDLLWRAEQKPRADYTVFMHLRREEDGVQVSAFDSPPQPPTSGWAIGAVITDTRAVPIPAEALPGTYRVVIGWYLYPTFERLPIAATGETEHVAARVVVE
ncbi:MAG: glycosyltransferase family 39 protein [Anaerolineae bacterium]|nr:glycosyltransferase family 39 protein [Anaerolineae bacterium]